MKKHLCLGLCLALLFCLAGCRKSADTKSKKPTVSENSTSKNYSEPGQETSPAQSETTETTEKPATETATPQESIPATKERPSTPQEQQSAEGDEVSEYVKTNMDICEQAAIEYVNYMMANSTLTPEGRVFRDNADGGMEARQKYINTASVQFKIKNMDLSPADRAYYNEVSARIDKLFAKMNGQ